MDLWKVKRTVTNGYCNVYLFKQVNEEWKIFVPEMLGDIRLHSIGVYHRNPTEAVASLRKGGHMRKVSWMNLAEDSSLTPAEIVERLKERIFQIREFEKECQEADRGASFEEVFEA